MSQHMTASKYTPECTQEADQQAGQAITIGQIARNHQDHIGDHGNISWKN